MSKTSIRVLIVRLDDMYLTIVHLFSILKRKQLLVASYLTYKLMGSIKFILIDLISAITQQGLFSPYVQSP